MRPARPTSTAHRPSASPQYVTTVHNAFVEGEGGLVYDAAGRAYHLPHHFYTRTGALPPLPTHTPAQVQRAEQRCACYRLKEWPVA